MSKRTPFEPPHQAPLKQPLYVWKNPGKVIDRNGRSVDTAGEVWQLHDPTTHLSLNWNKLNTAADVKDAMKAYLVHSIESLSPNSGYQFFQQLKYGLTKLPVLNSAWDLDYPILEGASVKMRAEHKPWRFQFLRRWYRWCADQGILGFREDTAQRLYQLKVPNSPTGYRVMMRDVEEGPLSNDEHFLLRQAVKQGVGPLLKRVIIMLLLEIGARPAQLILLEEHDFKITLGPARHAFYSLTVPRLKQGTVGEPEKKKRRISLELGKLIEALINANHRRYGDGGPRMPLLCAQDKNNKKLPMVLQARYSRHMRLETIQFHVESYARVANIISPRTGQTLRLTSRRLRYTFFTLLAEQGTATSYLAELADHSDHRSIAIYVASTSNVVNRLNAALGKDQHYSETIKRFLGEIIPQSGSAGPGGVVLGSTPTLKTLGGIGVCGAQFICNLNPPLSCYICPKFQAWIDGPHEKLLLELETYVQQLTQRSGNPSDRIPHQFVEVVAAIQQLLKRIQEIKERTERAGN